MPRANRFFLPGFGAVSRDYAPASFLHNSE
jgi:hypothetical protein